MTSRPIPLARQPPDSRRPLLDVSGLHVELMVGGTLRPVIHDLSLEIRTGEAVGLVGESGSGKSMTARAIARLLPAGAVVSGDVTFDGQPVMRMGSAELRRYRTRGIAMIFQDPRAHTNPVRRIGDFLTEALRTTMGVPKDEAGRRAVATLAEVGIDDGERRLRQYPHELSGGMLQRVMIAAALLAEPKLLLADEPTTALDVTTQAEVMAILDDLRRERGVAVLFITHDLELAAAVCDRTCVMYAGEIVERQASSALNAAPLHPYTAALLAARPRLEGPSGQLPAIPGRPRSAFEVGEGCAFADRCPYAEPECVAGPQVLRPIEAGQVRCRRAEEIHAALRALSVEAGSLG
jgi:oligopeptide/dipeptide ABC transporter ATP-binding protein